MFVWICVFVCLEEGGLVKKGKELKFSFSKKVSVSKNHIVTACNMICFWIIYSVKAFVLPGLFSAE